MRPAFHAAIAVVVGLLIACGGEGGPDCSDTGTPVLELGGTTAGEFVALGDGERSDVSITAKGYFALTPSLRTVALFPGEAGRIGDADDPAISIRAYVGETYVGGTDVSPDDGQPLDEPPHWGLSTTEAGAELIGFYVIFVDGIEPLDYLNQTVSLRGEVTDGCDRVAVDDLDVLAHWQY